MEKVIITENLSREFVRTQFSWKKLRPENTASVAVQKISLEVESGDFVGFLGPNGAGKTTFLKMLSGIIYPSSGTVKVLGHTPSKREHEYLRRIAIVMGQKNQLWWDLPAIDSYKLLQAIYDVPKAKFNHNLEMMIESLQMKELLTKRLRNMSLGERMKCELAASFLHAPEIIFLDEPTIGLDVVSSQSIRTFLKTINKEKKCTIILTSHYMRDIEELCRRVIIVNKGQKIYDGNLEQLRGKFAAEKIIEIFLDDLEDKQKFAHLSARKKHLEGQKGIIRIGKENLSDLMREIFDNFDFTKVNISDPEAEEIITKIFQEKVAEIA